MTQNIYIHCFQWCPSKNGVGYVLLSLIHCKWKGKVKSLSRVQFFLTPWTVAHQAPPSMEFSRQEYWSGLPFPSPGDLPDPGIEPRSPTLQADALTSEPPGKPTIHCKQLLNKEMLLLLMILVLHPCFSKSSFFENTFLHHFQLLKPSPLVQAQVKTHLCAMHLWSVQRRQDYTTLERVSSTNGAGKIGQLHVKQ